MKVGGFAKLKKRAQVVSGWAKHAGTTDDHQRANRRLRRRLKQWQRRDL